MQLFDEGRGIKNVALGAGVGNDGANEVLAYEAFAQVDDFHLEVNRAGTLRGDGKHLRVQAGIEHYTAALLYRTGHKAHGLSRSRSLIQERGIRNR